MTEKTIAELEREVDKALAAQQAAERKLQEKRSAELTRIAEAQTAYRQNLIDHGKEWDTACDEASRAAYDAATQAITAGDLNGAYKAFTDYKAQHLARARLRTEYLNAVSVLGEHRPYSPAEYTDRSAGWDEFLNRAVQDAAAINGQAAALARTGEFPHDRASAEEYLSNG